MTKNKFAYPPYLSEYNELVAVKLGHILRVLSETCLKHQTVDGARITLDLLISRPSQIRKCDLPSLKSVVNAIKMLEHLVRK